MQSFLYHRLLVLEPNLKNRLHREFPVIVSHSPRNWVGMLDLAITDECSNNFSLLDVKIDYAIELKFVRDWKTGLSPKSLAKFESECRKDCNKLLTHAINFKDETKKYFYSFRLPQSAQIEDVKNIFDTIAWNGIESHYVECYPEYRGFMGYIHSK